MKFKCPECGETRLEEVLVDVVQYTEILDIAEEDGLPIVNYGDHMLDGGEVTHFQCLKCGEHIADTEAELLDYLKERDML